MPHHAILVTVGFFLLGHAGLETFESVVGAAARNPFDETGASVPVVAVGTGAAVTAGIVFLTGRYLARSPAK